MFLGACKARISTEKDESRVAMTHYEVGKRGTIESPLRTIVINGNFFLSTDEVVT